MMTTERFEMLVAKFYAKASNTAAKRYKGLAAAAGLEGDDAVQMAAIYALEQFRAGIFDDYSDAEFGEWFVYRARYKMRKASDRARDMKRDISREQPIGETVLPAADMRSLKEAEAARDEVAALHVEFPQYSEVMQAIAAGMDNAEAAEACGCKSRWAVKRIKENIRKAAGVEYAN